MHGKFDLGKRCKIYCEKFDMGKKSLGESGEKNTERKSGIKLSMQNSPIQHLIFYFTLDDEMDEIADRQPG